MSTKLFRVEDEALQDARVRALSGDAFVLVLAPGKFRFFSTKEVLGFLSWTAVLGAGQERIDLDYGHDVPNGLHEFEARGRRVTYRAPDGKDYFGPTEGKIFLEVERPRPVPLSRTRVTLEMCGSSRMVIRSFSMAVINSVLLKPLQKSPDLSTRAFLFTGRF